MAYVDVTSRYYLTLAELQELRAKVQSGFGKRPSVGVIKTQASRLMTKQKAPPTGAIEFSAPPQRIPGTKIRVVAGEPSAVHGQLLSHKKRVLKEEQKAEVAGQCSSRPLVSSAASNGNPSNALPRDRSASRESRSRPASSVPCDTTIRFNEQVHQIKRLGRKTPANKLFHCEKTERLMKEVERRTFATARDLYEQFVKPMNESYGAEFYVIKWSPDAVALSVKCRAQACPFKLEFNFDKAPHSDQPIDLRWRRTVTASHHVASHEACRLTKMKNSLADYK